MRKLIITASLLAGLGFVPTFVFAQFGNNGAGSNSGSFGSMGSSGGSSGFGGGSSSSLSGSSAFGGSGGFGSSSAFGSSGFGGSGGSGFGSTSGGMGGQSGFGGQSQGGNFIGANQNPNQFLGRSPMGQTNGQGMNAGGMNQFGAGNRAGGRGATRGNQNAFQAMNGGASGGNGSNQLPLIRPRLRVAFDAPIPNNDSLQTTLETRLTKMSVKNPGFNSVMVAMNTKGEVVLRGTVNSESESKLAANLMRLEPGVRFVRNELTFPESSADEDN